MEMERALFDQDLFSLDKPNNVIHLEISLFELIPKSCLWSILHVANLQQWEIVCLVKILFYLNHYSFFCQKINFSPQNVFSTYVFYQRYLETGNYKGFLPTALQFPKQHYNLPDSNILPWQIYTPKDVQLQSTKTSTDMSGNPLSHTHCN